MIEALFNEIFGLAFNELNVAKLIAGGIFALLGLSLNYLLKVKPVINKENTFSCKYFIKNNWKNLLTTLILLFLALRFTQEFLGLELTMWTAVIIGYGVDALKDKFTSKMTKYFESK